MIRSLYLILFVLGKGFWIQAQTTITASYSSTVVVVSPGLTYVTFAIRNTNSYPVILTDLTCLQANVYENNIYNLWFSPTSLSGTPSVASPVWTLLASSPQPMTSNIITYVHPFQCLNLTIPPSTTYRFALEATKGTSVRGAVTPNIFSAAGVELLVGNNTSTGGTVGFFGWQNLGLSVSPYYFDGSVTLSTPGAYQDLELRRLIKPSSLCSAASNTVLSEICNRGPSALNFATNPVSLSTQVSGPVSTTLTTNLSSGTLLPCNCLQVNMGTLPMSASGTYSFHAQANLPVGVDADTGNNRIFDTLINYKPIVTPYADSICQYSSGPLFPGFNATGCQTRAGRYTLTVPVLAGPPIDGTNDATAGLFVQASLPGLPSGAIITGGRFMVTNLNGSVTGSLCSDARFSIYSPAMGPAAPFVPGIPGSTLIFSVFNFDYIVDITATQMNNLYSTVGPGGLFAVGYWEAVDNLAGASDIALNAQFLPTQFILLIDYEIPPGIRWYTNPSGGSSFSALSSMNPFTTAGSGISSTTSTGNFTWYVSCLSDTLCRVPVQLEIKPSPVVVQDSLSACEWISSSGNGYFDLNTLNGPVSAFNPLATVSYFQDYNLTIPIMSPSAYSSNSGVVYAKVEVQQCASSDSVVLTVHLKPQFVSTLVTGTACFPSWIDAAALIDPFSISPPGTDTLYFEDAAYTLPHPQPHQVVSADTVYMLLRTNTIPACEDSSTAIVQVLSNNPFIVNQDTLLNFSVPGTISCSNLFMTDGLVDTLESGSDCSRIISISDLPNGISLGSTMVCGEIETSVPNHHGQPYVARHYEVHPQNPDSATICLYFLDDDLFQYNNASFGSWPPLPTSSSPSLLHNLCVTVVGNGHINTPGHTVYVIPHNAITATYDSNTTVWNICFTTDSFGYFYLHSQNPMNIALGFEWLDIAVHPKGNYHEVKWQISGELPGTRYELERSANGQTFESLGVFINGAENAQPAEVYHYSAYDHMPLRGLQFYRIKRSNPESGLCYSQVVQVNRDDDFQMVFYPNPVIEVLNLQGIMSTHAQLCLSIYDVAGRLVFEDQWMQQGANLKRSWDLNHLQPGLYHASVIANNSLLIQQVLRKR